MPFQIKEVLNLCPLGKKIALNLCPFEKGKKRGGLRGGQKRSKGKNPPSFYAIPPLVRTLEAAYILINVFLIYSKKVIFKESSFPEDQI